MIRDFYLYFRKMVNTVNAFTNHIAIWKKKTCFFFYYLEHYMLTGKVLCLSQETSVKTEMASYNIRRLLIGPNQRFSSPSMCDPVGSARGCLTRTRWLHWKQTPKNVLQYIYIPVSLHADIVNLYFSN